MVVCFIREEIRSARDVPGGPLFPPTEEGREMSRQNRLVLEMSRRSGMLLV